MSTLLLKLRGPLQSWGSASRYMVRHTDNVPTKSGVVGLCAAALGRERTADMSDLSALMFGVRVDQPGTILRDFQTAQRAGEKNTSIITRYYLQDACFVAGLEGPRDTLAQIAEALKRPVFPLFLGRRSCPASTDILLGVHDSSLEESLRSLQWQAAQWYQRRMKNDAQHLCKSAITLPIFRYAHEGERGDAIRDVPVSFSQEERRYAWREVVECEPVHVPVASTQPEAGLRFDGGYFEAVDSQ